MCRKLALLALALWIATAGAAGWFFIKGSTKPSEDGRTAILLAPGDRDFVLAEMRALLAAAQGVAQALAANDAEGAAKAAASAGAAIAHEVPPALMASLPLEFKRMGMSVHAEFDDLANAARAGEPADWQMGRLGKLMQTCVACHQLYRLEASR